MLHTLSSDRAFGSSLNKTFDGHTSLPSSMRIPNFHGTYGDYLIQSIHSLIATTKRTLRSLYPSLVMTIHNISPSLKRISSTTANRLLQLTVSFGSPSFLLAEASNHELLGNMLDAINYMLYYQASENPNLIYAMVQYETKLQSMAKFTLANGLEDIHRLRLAKERQAAASSLQQQSPPQSSRRPSLTQRSMSSDRVAMASQGTKRPSVKTRTSTSTISSIDTPTHSTFGNPLGSHSATTGAASTHHLPPVYSDGQWSPTPLSSRSVWKAEDSSSSTSKTASGTSAHVNRLSLERAEKDRANRLSRLDSADSILTPLSDGGGNEGDVEDEGGLSTMPRARKLSNGSSNGGAGGGADHPSDSGLPISLEGLSEKQRGKLPEAVAERLSRASSDQEEGGDHGFHERSYFTRKDTKHPSGLAPLIHPGGGGGEEGGSAATTTRYKPLEARSITSQGVMLTTTVYDVGQNGFVPTEEWVEGWMKDARFEPIVVTLKHTVPVIEQLQATTDQQVLEFIQREISPRMLTSILPSYTFSTATASVVDGGASLSASSSSSTLSSPSPVTATGATTSAPTAAPSSTTIKPPIIMHKFVWGELTVWFDGLLWSQIYLGGMGRLGRQGMGAWHETRVRLFVVRVSSSTQQQQQQASLGTGMRQQYSAQSHAAGGSNLLGSSGSRGTARSLSMTSSSSPSSSSPLSNLYNAIPRTIVTAAPMSPTVTTAPSPVS
ncbi:hypothetical protein BGZ73_007780 [Actinomortierella ambigua]|nr:hypothetical protein BGZ73_007780 [Actinomortierella ambigua]